MDFTRQITQMFHDEHLQTIATLERLEALLHAHRKGPPADPAADAEFGRTLSDVEALIASDVVAHFAFEEESLFPLLAEAGDSPIAVLLTEEHRTILAAAEQLSAMCRRGRAGELDGDGWRAGRAMGMEFVELMVGHIQKEEMGLLPMLDDIIDDSRDGELVMNYSAAR